MNSKQRVSAAIDHKEADRIPLNIWMFREDTSKMVTEKYGSLDAFYDRYNIDIHMEITPPPCLTNLDYLEENMIMEPEDIKPGHWMDPDDPRIYEGISRLISKYGKDKSIFVHIWGVLESVYGFCGIERTLMLMAQDPDFAKSLFEKAADFSKRVVMNLLEFDIDIIHITGDVGSNSSMLFSPVMWRTLIMPFDREIIRPAIEQKIPVSLHSCGYCMPVIQDWIDMGIKLIHPIQESAGMDLYEVKDRYGAQITINGGLDIRDLSRMKISEVDDYVKKRVEYLKKGGGFIFNTSHTVQTDTSLEVLERAYDAAMEYGCYERQ